MIKYFKTLWENNITPVNGRNLNKIEDALEYLYDVIRNVPSEENVRIANEKQRQKDETTRSNSEIKRNATFDSKIKDVDKAINASNENIVEVNNKFESITASKQQDAEVILSRDGEVSLPARLKRDLYVDNIPLKQKVLDIEGLKEMQDLEYETDAGYKVCQNTKNGVVKDLKLYGKSLLNEYSSTVIENSSVGFITKTNNKAVDSFATIINRTNKKIYMNINNSVNGDWLTTVELQADKSVYFESNNFFIADVQGRTIDGWNDSNKSDLRKIICIKGNHTQNPPSYFEGIASVGNGNEIEVLSRKEDGNLLEENIKLNVQVPVFIPKGEYTVSCKTSAPVVIRYYRKDMSSIDYWSLLDEGNGVWSRTFTSNEDIYYVLMQSDNAKDIILNKGSIIKPYMPCKQDKKPILFKDADGNWKPVTELRGIDLNSCDSIENGYLRSNIGLMSLVGNENFIISTSRNETTLFILNSSEFKINSKCLCDKLTSYTISDLIKNDIEGIAIHDTLQRVVISISKSKATTVEQLKAYFQTNNINFLFEKSLPMKYEVSPLDTEAFENETLWMIESGPVSSHAEFKVTSSIQNFAKNTAERVDRLEDEVYKMNLANFAVSLNALELKSRLEALEAPRQ